MCELLAHMGLFPQRIVGDSPPELREDTVGWSSAVKQAYSKLSQAVFPKALRRASYPARVLQICQGFLIPSALPRKTCTLPCWTEKANYRCAGPGLGCRVEMVKL